MKKGKKKLLVTVAVLISLLGLSACSKADTQTSPEKKESKQTEGKKGIDVPIQILGVVMTMDHTFQQQMAAGWRLPVEHEGKDVKIDLKVEDPQGSIDKEIEITETYMKQGIDAWIGYPLNGEAMAPVAAEMKKQGTYVLTEGNNIPDETMGMVTDERDGGLLGGEMFVKWWKENRPKDTPHILVLDAPTSEAFQRKPDAFVEYVKDKMPEAVFVGQQDAKMEVEKAMDIVSTYILSNPEMNFVFCGVDSNAVGAMAAIESAGREDIAIAGCGGEDNVLPYLYEPLTEKKGGFAFEVAYEKSAIELGHLMVTGAVQLVMDPENADYNIIDLGFTALTRENLDEYVANKNEWLEKIGEKPLNFDK